MSLGVEFSPEQLEADRRLVAALEEASTLTDVFSKEFVVQLDHRDFVKIHRLVQRIERFKQSELCMHAFIPNVLEDSLRRFCRLAQEATAAYLLDRNVQTVLVRRLGYLAKVALQAYRRTEKSTDYYTYQRSRRSLMDYLQNLEAYVDAHVEPEQAVAKATKPATVL